MIRIKRYGLPTLFACAIAIFHGAYQFDLYPNMMTAIWCLAIFAVGLFGMLDNWEDSPALCVMLGAAGTFTGLFLVLQDGDPTAAGLAPLGLAFLTSLAGILCGGLIIVQKRITQC